MAKKVIVGGRIESKEVGGIVTGAAEILDDTKGKKQNVINQETDAELERLDGAKQNVLTFDNTPTEGSNNPVKSAGVYAADKALSDAIEAILLLIPGAASALNKLVDMAMMNSSISTATATFRGTYNVVTDLELAIDATHEQIAAKLGEVINTADNNDYAFVQVPVSAESTDIRRTERYKFNGTAWAYEYDLNTSGFTAAQWAAINSGITIALVAKLNGLPTSSQLTALLGQKQDTLTFDNVPTAGSNNPVKSGGINTAISNETEAREQLAQSVSGIDGRVGNIEAVIPAGAAANNKLVANSSMEAYVASIIDAITASFTIATADGHINLTLTQTNGRVASLTLTSSDIASAQALTALTGRVSTAEGNITTLGGRVSTNETDIANLQQLYNNLQQSKPIPVTALPETGQQQGVIYRLAGTTSYSDYMWNGSTWVLMATYNNAIDPRPKKASQNLVTSGGVFDNMGALDVSELNATENPHTLAQYVDLSAALAAIPTDYQKGGMSIKFVQSSDNKYVKFFCTAQNFTTDVTQWQGVDDEPTINSDNLIKSKGVFNELNKTNNTLNLLNGITKSAGATVSTNFNIPLLLGTNVLVECSSENAADTTFGGYLNDGSFEDIRKGLSPGSKTEITLTKDYTRFFTYSSHSHTETLYAGISIKTENLIKNVGDIQSLTTENKSNIVSAINEIISNVVKYKVYDISGNKNQAVIINTPFNSGDILIFFNVGSNTAWFGGYLSDGSYEDISSKLGPQQYEIITLTKNYTKLYTYSSSGNYQVIISKLNKKEINLYEIINDFENQLSSFASSLSNIDANSYKEIGLSPFIKFGSVGDSLSVGEWHEVGTTYVNKRDLKNSWGQILARKHGNTCLNFGYAGATCKSFLTSETHGFAELAQITEGEKINLCQAYIIGLGTNDTDTIGTPEDIDWSDYNNNENTFYGNYAKLVQKIREFAPKSIIFCLSIPYPRNSAAKNTVISYIANNENLEGVYLVDLASNPYNAIYASASVQGFYYEGHFNAAGYAICASIMDRAIGDTIIANNTDAYIRNISGIPYGTNIIE